MSGHPDDALRRTAERLQLALDAGRLGDWEWDAATDGVALSPRAAAMFELPEGAPTTWAALRRRLDPEDEERAREAVERAMATRSDYDIEYRVRRSDGEIRWIAARGRGRYRDDGSVIGMSGVVQDVTERRRAEEARRAGEQRLRVTFQQAAVGIASADLDGRFTEMNPKFSAILGYGEHELLGRTFADVTHPGDLAMTLEEIRRLRRGEIGDYSIEKRYVRKDGSVVWSLTTVTLLRDGAGTATHYIGVIEDISRRKEAEEALRRSEQFSRTIVESSRDCIKTLDLEGRLLWISDVGVEALGLPGRESVSGSSYATLWDGEARAGAEQAVREAAAGGTGSFVGALGRGEDTRWWDVVITPIAGPDGRPERLLAVSRDVTSRIRSDRRLLEETRILETLNRTGASLASELDAQSIIQAVTDAGRELSGAQFGAFFHNHEDENGQSYMLYTLSGAPREAFERFGHPRATPLFGPTFRGEGSLRLDDVTQDPRYGQWGPHYGMPEGHLRVRSYLAVPVISRTGRVLGGLFFGHSDAGVFTSRSERLVGGLAAQAAVALDNARLLEGAQRAAEERKQLLESERAARSAAERMSEIKDEFLATLSHELRTPLSAILGWSHALRLSRGNPKDLEQGLEAIERNARVQTQLIEDLLDMSRITSGKLMLDLTPQDPAAPLEAAIETVRAAAQAKGIALERTVPPGMPGVLGDAGRLQQIFWNLLSNAIKFTPPGGRVAVELRSREGAVEAVVADSGIGIKPDFLPHVFERFRQADASTTRRHGGLGLGLSIVRHLVELHGGTVSVASEGEGRGATFVVSLPAAREAGPASAGAPDAPASSSQDLSGLAILVVDDQPDTRNLVARVLSDAGAVVIVASGAEEALKRIREAPPDVIISDIGMPDVDGLELIRRVRALGPEAGGKVPAIALTALARSEDRTRALRAGFLVHVSKPVDPTELIATVASVAERVRATE